MLKAKRLGYVVFETPDLERQLEHYTEVVGLAVVTRDAERVYLASRAGQLAVVLERGSISRCKRLGLEVSPGVELAAAEKVLRLSNIAHATASDSLPGISKLITLADAQGTSIELYGGWSLLEAPPGDVGAGALKLGHIAFFCSEPQRMVEFYADVLGFRVSDWIGDRLGIYRWPSSVAPKATRRKPR